MNRHLQQAFDHLMTDDNFIANFRQSPEQTLQGYSLSPEEIAALKSGDEGILADLGVDLEKYMQNPSDLPWFGSALARFAPGIAAALIVFSLSFPLGVNGATRSSIRTGRRTGKRTQPRMAPVRAGNPIRISGTTQYDTAVEIAKQGWTAGATKNAVLAYGGSNKACLADALASGPLASALGAPIFLTDGDTLTPAIVQELKDLGVTTVYVTSGTSVIKKTVLDQLTAYTVKPVWGQDAPSTSVEIAKAIARTPSKFPPGSIATSVALANGTVGAQDALSVASIASAQMFPILITDNNARLPKVVKDYLATLSTVTKSYVIGGTFVISDDQKSELTGAVRLSGNDAYDTNAAVIKAFNDAKSVKFDHVFVANGETLVDALSGAALAGKYNSVIVLTDGANLKASETVNPLLSSSSIVTALGGEYAVPAAIFDRWGAAVGDIHWVPNGQPPMDAAKSLSVTSLSAINADQLEVVFSAPVNPTSATSIGNYYTVNAAGIATPLTSLSVATLQADNMTVIITLNTPLINGGAYGFKVSGVTPAYLPMEGRVSLDSDENENTAKVAPDYTTKFIASDTTAPTLVSATATGQAATNTITLTFSEPVDTTLGTVAVNGVSATLKPGTYAGKNTVTVTSESSLMAGTEYSLDVRGFQDFAKNIGVEINIGWFHFKWESK